MNVTAAEPLTPKRLKSDAGVDSLYPYYAGFSSRFAQKTLESLSLKKGATVLDPWNGSGTTTTAATVLGLRGIGFDLNPFAGVVASAKLATQSHAQRMHAVAGALCGEVAQRGFELDQDDEDPLLDWLPPSAAAYVRALMNAFKLDSSRPSRGSALLTVALARALRPLVTQRTKNPTWTVPSGRRLTKEAITERFASELTAIVTTLSPIGGRPSAAIMSADARRLPLADGSVDVVLTSPPYLTRIDYGNKTSFELALLGIELEADLRTNLMGTTALRGQARKDVPKTWPARLRAMLIKMRNHPSHRSEGYYFPNALQYFDDADLALRELHRVLVTKGMAFLVLQDSYYKELHFDLPDLFLGLACGLGFTGEVVRREPVRKVMTSVNTASRGYLPTREYTESIVKLQR